MLVREHPVLSEKPEDQIKSAKWAELQIQKMERNKQIGDEVWERILPMIQKVRSDMKYMNGKDTPV